MKITQETFLRDVKNHQMTILKDDGVFRCIEFRNPADRGTYFFYLTTFPGRMVISGDCGTYVFSRINDMFEFFRGKYIDFSYWASKADAEDTRDGIRVFNVDKLKQQLTDNFNDFKDCWPCSKEDEEEFQEDILDMIEDEHTFVALGSKRLNCGFEIEPWEYSNVYDFSPRFIWNCYAINWGIDQYDKLSAPSEMSAAGYKGEFSVYVLAKEVDDTLVRIEKLMDLDKRLNPVVMPYRNLDGDGKIVDPQVAKLANWCNKVSERKSCAWKDYKYKLKEVEK